MTAATTTFFSKTIVGALLLCALATGGCSEGTTATSQTGPAASRSAAATASEAMERTNKDTVARAYAAWAAGGTNFFDILDDDVVWTILGTGPSAGIYRGKADFMNRAVAPFSARLSAPLAPTVRAMHADGDQVVTLWDGEATLANGQPYRNTYAWFFTMRDGRVVEARALLNLAAYDAVIANVRPVPAR